MEQAQHFDSECMARKEHCSYRRVVLTERNVDATFLWPSFAHISIFVLVLRKPPSSCTLYLGYTCSSNRILVCYVKFWSLDKVSFISLSLPNLWTLFYAGVRRYFCL